MSENKLEKTKKLFAKSNLDLYHKMIEEIEDYAIILLDIEGHIINWNKGAEKIKGYTESEILGKHFSTFYLPEDIKAGLPNKLLKEAHDTGKAVQEGWRKRKNGSKFWGSITITAVHDLEGNVIGYSKVTRDLTERKEAEDKLRRSEERYHRMISEVQDYAIILLNEKGEIENWNLGAEKIKGYKSEEILGKHFSIFYPPDDLKSGLPFQLLETARVTGKATHEGWRLRKDGSRFWGLIVITALHNKNNEVIGFSKVTRDLTDKKLASDKLLSYTAELEIQNSELEQFAYVASHDLQEPLRKIQTFSILIEQKSDDKEFVKRYFEKLNQAAQRMSALIKSLLNYSRLSKNVTEISPVDLNKTIEDVKQDFELLISERNTKIITENLPTINGNQTQLGQLFSNLIGNSLKFSQKDPLINITAKKIASQLIPNLPRRASTGDYYHIAVTDNGIGFEQQYEDVIFTLFQRLHNREDYSGTGIGLALCKKIVDNHGGIITASSKPNEGATFNIYLPAR